MYCLRCGTQNADNASYCRNCRAELGNSHYDQSRYSYNYSQTGDSKSTYSKPMDHEQYYNYSYKYSNNGQNPTQISNNHQDQYSYSYNYSNNEVISGDELYVYNYVGSFYKHIKNQKFSFSTLIFGPLHFLYRKLFFYAIIWLFALATIYYYIPNYFQLFYIAMNFFLATKFSEIYLNKVEQSVDKIKHQSLELTSKELLDKCKKSGGTLIKPITIVPLLIIISVIASIAPIVYDIYQISTNNDYSYDDNYYDEDIYKEEELTNKTNIKDLEFEIPEGFTENYSSTYSKTYTYETTDDLCRISLYSNNYVSSYSTDDEFLNNNIYIENPPLSSQTTLNNTTWAMLVYNPNPTTTYYNFAHIHNNTGYLVTYDIVKDDTTTCSTKFQEFISTLNFK